MALSGARNHGLPSGTYEKIVAAARQLGYVPNRSAQALKTRKTRTIACVVPDIANPFYPALMRGVQSVAEDGGYDVIAVNTGGEAAREQRFLDWSLRGVVDGVVGVFFTLRAKDFGPLAQAGVALVRIETENKRVGSLPIDNLCVDNDAAACAATEYLIARGHRRVAMIAGQGGPEGHRTAGYVRAMAAAGLSPHLVALGKFDEDGGYRAASEIVKGRRCPTAIFAANDLMALGAMTAIREAALTIPDDVAIMGFDDIFAARVVTPSLSTVNQFQYELGRAAAEMALERLETEIGDAPGRSKPMPFEIVRRQSA